LREIGEGRQKTLNIKGLARAALEREREVIAYRVEAVDRGRFSGHVQPCRRERRSGSEDSLGNRADSLGNRVRRSREPGRFSEESRRHTSLFYRQFFRTTPCFGSIQSDYSRLTIDLRQPGPGHGRRRRWRRRGRKAFEAIWPPGIMGTRDWPPVPGRRRSQPRQACCPRRRGSSLTEPCPVSPARNTSTGNPADTEWRLSAGFSVQWLDTSRTIVRVLDRRQGNRNRQGDARRADTRRDTHPIIAASGGADVPGIPEVAGEQSGAAMPRSMPGTLLSESRCGTSSRTTRASPKRATPGWRKRRRSRARRVQARSLTPALRVGPSRRRWRSDHGGGW